MVLPIPCLSLTIQGKYLTLNKSCLIVCQCHLYASQQNITISATTIATTTTNPSTTINKTMRDGADAETVVCALFHDVGEVLNHVNHGEIGETLVCFDHHW